MASAPSLASACIAQSIPLPSVSGANILSLHATPVTDFSLPSIPIQVWTKSQFDAVDFCNVTVKYTRPGLDHNITVQVYLPPASEWNGRFVGAGGSGYAATQGLVTTIPPVDAGFAVASTDGGVSTLEFSSAEWTLLSPGNPDYARINIWSSVVLNDLSIIGKSVTNSFYGQAAAHSYWVGCSQGGRQGNMIAQRYPDAFDGIIALAPAINWAEFFPSMQFPHQFMYESNYAILTYNCDGTNKTFTTKGVKIIQDTWTGPRAADGSFLWYGYGPDADLSYVANTTCTDQSNCTVAPFSLPQDWLQLWVAEDPTLNMSNLTRDDLTTLIHQGINRYDSVVSARDPDISNFRNRGGKMLTWHGYTDQLIPYQGSQNYHDRIRELDANVDDYFHLIDWVEKGIAPEQLNTVNLTNVDPNTGMLMGNQTTGRGRPICLYPKVQEYINGDADMMSSFRCVSP
ncbi:tannase and feruloyl esterase [Aureobasidium pullulans]|uniref:Carboxylic ester hydrolase n=1 Tax=Aureobasidium pullulans TaxID=5580 RepID=A0A4S9S767_AURPU|nr:tannase and feruloyl esterase [Aureobasidium pullulans]